MYPSLTLYPSLTIYPRAGFGAEMHPYLASDGSSLPRCVVRVIDDPAVPDSFGNIDTGQATVRFDMFTATKAEKSIARSVSADLHHFSGDLFGISIKSIDCTGVRDIQVSGNLWQWQFDAMVEYVIP